MFVCVCSFNLLMLTNSMKYFIYHEKLIIICKKDFEFVTTAEFGKTQHHSQFKSLI